MVVGIGGFFPYRGNPKDLMNAYEDVVFLSSQTNIEHMGVNVKKEEIINPKMDAFVSAFLQLGGKELKELSNALDVSSFRECSSSKWDPLIALIDFCEERERGK